ncbi:hypothetical protein HELRODRAFT_159817 [Helobdella robusta]|uniref:Histone H4 n=1 Tax=Helobdella robusta TaxID=6412 RepID=T1EPF8_HELRO|nr:hypothetical protein HELRODRAFT_159817 [Helobdella robusta]ESO13186.1 hypothetical protein HELRODRAFT_159817 [Helobdella robusta]
MEHRKYAMLPKKIINFYSDHQNVANEVSEVLHEDINYRIREILQVSFYNVIKCKRKSLHTSDIRNTLEIVDAESLYNSPTHKTNKTSPIVEAAVEVGDLLSYASQPKNIPATIEPNMEIFWISMNDMMISEDDSVQLLQYANHLIKCLQDVDDDISRAAFVDLVSCRQINNLLPYFMSYIFKKEAIPGEGRTISHKLIILKLIEAFVQNKYLTFNFNDLETILHLLLEFQTIKIPNVRKSKKVNLVDKIKSIKKRACMVAGVLVNKFSSNPGKMIKGYVAKLIELLDDSDDIDIMDSILMSLLHIDIKILMKQFLPKIQYFLKKIKHIRTAFKSFPSVYQLNEKSEYFYNILSSLTLFIEIVQIYHAKLAKSFDSGFKLDPADNIKNIKQLSYLITERKQLYHLYSMLYELHGDSVSLRLICSSIETGKNKVDLFDKEIKKSNKTQPCSESFDNTSVKAVVTNSQHGIKLKISKFSKFQKFVTHSSVNDSDISTCVSHKFVLKKPSDKNNLISKNTKNQMKLEEVFELTPFRIRDEILIPFRFKGKTILSTFTEKKKAQILAKNMAKQHASLSRYRELCSTLQCHSSSISISKHPFLNHFSFMSTVPFSHLPF